MSSTEMQDLCEKGKASHSSKSSSDEEPEEPEETDDVRVQFIQPGDAGESADVPHEKVMVFNGLDKDEVMKFAKDPFWRKVRIILLILFWVIWLALIVASVLIIVFTPKCPPIPKRPFWQKSSGYLLDVVTFKDSDGNGYGDLKGVINKLDYLETKGNHLVLASLIKGSLGTKDVRAPAVSDFKKVDEKVGTIDDVRAFIKQSKKRQLKALIEFPCHTGKYHEWFVKAAKGDKKFQGFYIWSSKSDSKMVNRVGKAVWNKVGSQFYFSSLHESVPALNLTNPEVLSALKDAVQFWLKEGFSGIFVDNVAFLAPEVAATDIGAGLDVSSIKTGDLKKWYGAGHTGQLMTNGAVKFLQTMRSWVDEIVNQAGRELYLLASAGNTGLKHDHNSTLELLGNENAPGAHSVVAMDLAPAQGAKVTGSKKTPSLRASIDMVLSSAASQLTLVTQTLSGPRSTDAVTSYMNLLLPTTALALYGEEIGMAGYGDKLAAPKTQPGPPYSFITQAALKDKKAYLDDLFDAYDVPMQWDSTGGFSSKITYDNKNNVMMEAALGLEMTRYKVFISLVKLRKEPSLNWGDLEWVESQEKTEPHHFIFSRASKGFPKYLVVLIRGTKKVGGLVRDLSKVCEKASTKLSAPPNVDFKLNKEIPMRNIHFEFSPGGSAFVFKCE